MTIEAYRDEIKLKLTGYVLEIELDDSTIDKVIQSALREMQRYITSTRIVTVPYNKCIDLSTVTDADGNKLKVSSVSRIFRTEGFATDNSGNQTSTTDPMLASQWQLVSGTSNLYNFQNYMYDYISWNTLLQIRNTTSTDLAFRYDKSSNKLYINVSSVNPSNITVEYVPRYDDVEEITSDYWIDILVRLAVSITKITLGRIRTRYTQSNALWQNDTNILDEGLTEYKEIQQHLQDNMNLVYPID